MCIHLRNQFMPKHLLSPKLLLSPKRLLSLKCLLSPKHLLSPKLLFSPKHLLSLKLLLSPKPLLTAPFTCLLFVDKFCACSTSMYESHMMKWLIMYSPFNKVHCGISFILVTKLLLPHNNRAQSLQEWSSPEIYF